MVGDAAEDRPEALAGTVRWPRLALASAAGGVSIALGDHAFHVRTRILEHFWYPQWDHQSLAVFPMFVGAAALMLVVAGPFVRHHPKPTAARLAWAVAAFLLAYWATGQAGTDHPWWCLNVLVATFLLRLAFEPDRRAVLLLGGSIAVGGCVGEAVVSALGLFTYATQDIIGVPLWLIALYLHGAPAVLALARMVQVDRPEAA
ncbi:MAG: putative rane protein [Acidimicrobiales bacterium]|nr:putative rane protein [Acidimicrobiales bacterium]